MTQATCSKAALALDDYLAGEADEATLADAYQELVGSLGDHESDGWCWALAAFIASVQDSVTDAVAHIEQAHRLAPGINEIALLRVALLIDASAEDRAVVALDELAKRYDVDLDGLRAELQAIGFPTDAQTLLSNGFPHARNWFASMVRERAEQARNAGDPRRARRLQKQLDRDCADAVAELAARLQDAAVPAELQDLMPWALRLGVGDDGCRTLLFERLSARDLDVLQRLVADKAIALQDWLDSFPEGAMPPAAAAYIYLALGVEEMAASA